MISFYLSCVSGFLHDKYEVVVDKKQIEKLQMDLLLEGIYQCYGYDFRDYAQASLKRRLQHHLLMTHSNNYLELLSNLLNNVEAFHNFILDITITVTEMFRDPYIYKAIQKYVIPVLKTYPFIKIWHAGCATGEEVYSMAILLHENGLLDKTQIYATDINPKALETAKAGIYPAEQVKTYSKNYQNAGGKVTLSKYFHANYGSVKMSDFLKKKITFAYHNLAIDRSFCEAQMIICRNVLIYFNNTLQDKVFTLFNESLSYGGFLFLGSKETLNFSNIKDQYDCILPKEKLYQKKYEI